MEKWGKWRNKEYGENGEKRAEGGPFMIGQSAAPRVDTDRVGQVFAVAVAAIVQE